MNKSGLIKTNVPGLDDLLQGGVRLKLSNDSSRHSMVIGIRGMSDYVAKLARQLVVGLHESIGESKAILDENYLSKISAGKGFERNLFIELEETKSKKISIKLRKNCDKNEVDLKISFDGLETPDEGSRIYVEYAGRPAVPGKKTEGYPFKVCDEKIQIIGDHERFKTGISGLDDIFYGGIQLSRKPKNVGMGGLVIALIGSRGVHKPLLAMQILHGLTKSIQDKWDIHSNSRFYSINKPREQLSNMYLNTVISKMISRVTVGCLDEPDDRPGESAEQHANSFCDFMFDTQNALNPELLRKGLKSKLGVFLREGILYYDTATHALHLRRELLDNPDQDNKLFMRKYNSVAEYLKVLLDSDLHAELKKELFNVEFNHHIEKNEADQYSFSESPIQQLNSILRDIERGSCTTDQENEPVPCIVLDGITQLAFNDLRDVNFTHLEKAFRSKALVSILIFNNKEVLTTCNADIIIDMERIEDRELNYTSHRLQVSKSVFQPAGYGWHQYKKRDHGIEVFCSPHLILHKRRFMDRMLRATHQGIFESRFDTYKELYRKDKIDEYPDEVFRGKSKEFNTLINNFMGGQPQEVIKNILLHPEKENKLPTGTVTALIGPPNTYKRFLAMAYAFYACSQNHKQVGQSEEKAAEQNTLIIFLDKNENTMVKRMLCPAMFCRKNEQRQAGERSAQGEESMFGKCLDCYDHLHSFELRMGCIGTDEFCYYIKELLRIAEMRKNPISRIIVDDLQKVEYSFPLFAKDNLFLTTFITLCKDKNVDLLFLCDRDIRFARELSALADNIIRTEQIHPSGEETKVTGATGVRLTVDKYSGYDLPGREYMYPFTNTENLFSCNGNELEMNVPV